MQAVGVIGPGAESATADERSVAFAVGRALGERGIVVVCGGLGGVMEEACRGAASVGGTSVGLLPGLDRASANAFVGVVVPTGMGELRNGLVVRASDALIAVGGGYGTLSEIALGLKAGKRVVGIGTWEIVGVTVAVDAETAVAGLVGG